MIGLLVTGHAHFGSGLTSSLNLIAGEQEHYKYVDFLPEYSLDDLSRELTKAMDELKDCEGILVFSDLPGRHAVQDCGRSRLPARQCKRHRRHQPADDGGDRDVAQVH